MDPIRSPTEYQTVSLAQKNRQAPFPSGIHFSGVRCRGTIRSIACCSIPLLSIYLFTPPPHPLATFSILWLEYYHSDILLAIHIE